MKPLSSDVLGVVTALYRGRAGRALGPPRKTHPLARSLIWDCGLCWRRPPGLPRGLAALCLPKVPTPQGLPSGSGAHSGSRDDSEVAFEPGPRPGLGEGAPSLPGSSRALSCSLSVWEVGVLHPYPMGLGWGPASGDKQRLTSFGHWGSVLPGRPGPRVGLGAS